MGRLRIALVVVGVCLVCTIAGAGVIDTTTSTDVSTTTDTTDTSTTDTTDTTTSSTDATTSSTEEPTTSTTEVPTTTTSSTEEPTTSTTEAPTTSTTEAPTTSTTEAPTTTTESTTTSIQSTTTTTQSTTTSLAQTTTTTTLGTTSSTAPGASTSTTAPASTSTTTTLPPQCNAGPSFASIDCRLTTLIQLVEATPDIQSQRARLVVRLTAAQMSTTLARTACSASDTKHTKRALAQAAKRLQQYRKLLRTKPAKRTMPAQLRADLDDAGDGIRSDVQTLRTTVACPGDATH